FLSMNRKGSPVEAPVALTRAYGMLEFAYGYARLGRAERARALRTAGTVDLPQSDPIHRLLAQAYSARIEQALEAKPIETPLPAAVATELNALDRFSRYKVDRLRQGSQVLEPVEGLVPFQSFLRAELPELSLLRTISEPDLLAAELERV